MPLNTAISLIYKMACGLSGVLTRKAGSANAHMAQRMMFALWRISLVSDQALRTEVLNM